MPSGRSQRHARTASERAALSQARHTQAKAHCGESIVLDTALQEQRIGSAHLLVFAISCSGPAPACIAIDGKRRRGDHSRLNAACQGSADRAAMYASDVWGAHVPSSRSQATVRADMLHDEAALCLQLPTI